jgi:hypothetical protein
MSARSVITVLLAVLAGVGCKPRATIGHFGDNAFYAARDHYRVRYLDGASDRRALLPDGWAITSFDRARGVPTVPRAVEPETHHLMQGDRAVRERVPPYELRYAHSDGSVIFVRSLPIETSRAPEALLRDYVRTSASAFGAAAALLGTTHHERIASHRTLAAGPARFDERPAHFATLEVVSARSRWRSTLIAVETPRRWRTRRSWGTLVIVGMSSPALLHDVHREELTSFAARLDIAR